MCNEKPMPLLGKIKDAIDAVYEMTVTPGGYHGHFKEYPTIFWRVVSVLCQRKIVSRERNPLQRCSFVYKWVATMHPTTTLYKSVEQEIRDKVRAYRSNERKKKERQPKTETPAVFDNSMVVSPIHNTREEGILDGFSAQELWDELKKRGFEIEGDHIVKKAYLN